MKELFLSRKSQAQDPHTRCKPSGGSRFWHTPYGIEIIDLPETKEVLFLHVGAPHSWRVVYLDGREHPKDLQPSWYGHSIGRWEGDTLVVDTTNFKRNTSLPGSSANMHLIERFTRTGPDALLYEFTVDDPSTWTKPWTAAVPTSRIDVPVYEYACHEGNYAMIGILAGARADEKTADAAKKAAK